MNNANLSAEEILAEEVYSDFERRRAERKNLERSWQLNLNFVNGNQYCLIDAKGEIAEEEKNYYWQERLVFNHIAPIVAARLAKLSRIRPALTVRAASDDETDRRSAELASRILAAAHDDGDLDGVMNTAAMWSETCGTAFYKVVWNSAKGRLIGLTDDGNPKAEFPPPSAAVNGEELLKAALSDEKVKQAIVAEYLKTLATNKAVPLIVGGTGSAAPAYAPKTVREAGALAQKFLKN